MYPVCHILSYWCHLGVPPGDKRGRKHCLMKTMSNVLIISSIAIAYKPIYVYFVSSRERQLLHRACPRINAARCILYASIPVFLFERVGKHTSCARDDKRLCLEYKTRWRHGCSQGETNYSRVTRIYHNCKEEIAEVTMRHRCFHSRLAYFDTIAYRNALKFIVAGPDLRL